MGGRQRKRRASRLPRRIAVALGSILLSVAVLSGALRAGGRYFYCDAMGITLTDPCTAPARDEVATAADELRERHIDCCKTGTLASMPNAAASERCSVSPAPLLAVIAPQVVEPLRVVAVASQRASRDRWRAPPRPPGELRAQRMVFLT
jgi:hypothetical protein